MRARFPYRISFQRHVIWNRATLLPSILILLFSVTGCTTTSPSAKNAQVIDIEPDDHGRYMKCGWYCGAPPISVSATSTFHDGIYSYSAENLHDCRKDTAWVEGIGGDGHGERIIFTFDMTERTPGTLEIGVGSVSIINGFARSKKQWEANSRVKTFKIYFDGEYLDTVELEDTREPQRVQLPKMAFIPGKKHEIAFEIDTIYPGTNFYYTAVSDFLFDGFGVRH